MSEDTIFERKKSVVIRKIHGAFFLVDISDNYAGDKCALYETNHIGAFIWNQIDGKRSLKQIIIILKENINGEVPETTLFADTKEYMTVLVEKSFVEVR